MTPADSEDLVLRGHVAGTRAPPAFDLDETLGYAPPSRLCVDLTPQSARRREVIEAFAPLRVAGENGDATCFPALVGPREGRGELPGYALIPDEDDDPGRLDVVAPVDIVEALRLDTDDAVTVEFTDVTR